VGHYGGSYKVTFDLYKKYGDMRLLDTPICGKLWRLSTSVGSSLACNSGSVEQRVWIHLRAGVNQ
jgi:pyruvate/2-oxoglutarate/acetoin dehydrogenase E1 component